jgi:hypothetical protein
MRTDFLVGTSSDAVTAEVSGSNPVHTKNFWMAWVQIAEADVGPDSSRKDRATAQTGIRETSSVISHANSLDKNERCTVD